MKRVRVFVPLAAWLLILPGTAAAQPDAGMSTIPNVILDPGGNLDYVVVIRNASGVPLSGVAVDLLFSPAAAGIICWCPGQVEPLISATTGGDGRAVFTILGAGCVDPAFVGPPVVTVSAGGSPMAGVGVVSPAAVDLTGTLPWLGWAEVVPPCMTGLADAVYLATFVAPRAYSFCADIDSNGRVGLSDAVLITESIMTAAACFP